MQSIIRAVCLIFTLLLTACTQESARDITLSTGGIVQLVQQEDFTTQGHGNYRYQYTTNDEKAEVKLWVGMKMDEGELIRNEELFIQQSSPPGTLEVEFDIQSNDDGKLVWYIRLGEQQRQLITPNYAESCVAHHYHVVSEGKLDANEELSIIRNTCLTDNEEHGFTYVLLMEQT